MLMKKHYFIFSLLFFLLFSCPFLLTKKRCCCNKKIGLRGPQGPIGKSGLLGSYIQVYSYQYQNSGLDGAFVSFGNKGSLSGWQLIHENTLSTLTPLTKNSTFAITYTINIISGSPFYCFLSNSGSLIAGSQFSLTPLQTPGSVTITAYLSLSAGQTPSVSLAYLGTIDPGLIQNNTIAGIGTTCWLSASLSIIQIA